VAPAEEYERKSVGTESTFGEIQGKEALRAKLRSTAEELEGDLKRTQFKGRTLVLKVKLHTFEVLTRQTVPPFAVFKADDLYRFALPMLTKLEKEIPNMRLRLMGLRCTGLVSTQKTDVDFFGMRRHGLNDDVTTTTDKAPNLDADGWEVWPEAEFEEAARQERQQEFEELERLSQEHAQEQREDGQSERTPKEQFWDCPICRRPQPADDRSLNEHIDLCLSRQTIRDVVRDAISLDASQSQSAELGSGIRRPPSASGKKRGRPRHDSQPQVERNVKRKSFFS
jgi:DNA polymerase kappa